jgi:hypothetical protein
MSSALPGKQLLNIGCCLSVVAWLAAQPAAPRLNDCGNDQPPRAGIVRPPALNEKQLQELAVNQAILERLRQLPIERRKRATPPDVTQWYWHWRWFVYALLALGGLGVAWGTKQVLTKKPSPTAGPPKPRVERLRLGADGKGGVWLREVYPWQE